jgi:hypothetical protein
MITKRKWYDAAFKAKVALEAIKNDRTIAEIASEHGVHLTLRIAWFILVLPSPFYLLHSRREKLIIITKAAGIPIKPITIPKNKPKTFIASKTSIANLSSALMKWKLNPTHFLFFINYTISLINFHALLPYNISLMVFYKTKMHEFLLAFNILPDSP